MKLFLRLLATFVGCAAAVWLIPGIQVVGPTPYMSIALFALVLSLANATIKPILQFLGTPITILTLGIFCLVINAILLGLSASVSVALFGSGLSIDTGMTAFLGAIVISIISGIVNGVLGSD